MPQLFHAFPISPNQQLRPVKGGDTHNRTGPTSPSPSRPHRRWYTKVIDDHEERKRISAFWGCLLGAAAPDVLKL